MPTDTFTACCGAPCPPEGGRCDKCKDNAGAVRECPTCEGRGVTYSIIGPYTCLRCTGTGVVPVEGRWANTGETYPDVEYIPVEGEAHG